MRTAEVCQLAGVSPRMLQWWSERRIVNPMNNGHARDWDETDVFRVLVIAELRKRGLSLARVRLAWPTLKRGKPGDYAVLIGNSWTVHTTIDTAITRVLYAQGPVIALRLPVVPSEALERKPARTVYRREYTNGREARA